MSDLRIAYAEDNHFLAKSIEEKLSFFDDLKLKYRAINGADLLEKLGEDHNVDVILMDIQMPTMDGIAATAEVKQRYPQIKIIMLTVFDDEESIFNAIRAGANGYLLKDEKPDTIHQSIHDIMNGGAPMSAIIASKSLEILRNPERLMKTEEAPDFQLTKRETEILEQLSKGLSYQLIGENLFISPATVRKHIENIYRKLQVHNKMEAVQLAMKHKII